VPLQFVAAIVVIMVFALLPRLVLALEGKWGLTVRLIVAVEVMGLARLTGPVFVILAITLTQLPTNVNCLVSDSPAPTVTVQICSAAAAVLKVPAKTAPAYAGLASQVPTARLKSK